MYLLCGMWVVSNKWRQEYFYNNNQEPAAGAKISTKQRSFKRVWSRKYQNIIRENQRRGIMRQLLFWAFFYKKKSSLLTYLNCFECVLCPLLNSTILLKRFPMHCNAEILFYRELPFQYLLSSVSANDCS